MRAVTVVSLLASALCLMTANSAAATNVFAVLQDPTGTASVVVYNETGDVTATSDTHWNFRWPVAETTVDINKKQISVISFPNPSAQATLFTFNYGLGAPANTQVSPTFAYFDLEFSPRQNTYYGIAVSSRYGRVLSQFTDFNAPVAHTPIYTLPYMWYVNASTFDRADSRYFALVNNFPGFANSTTNQLLVIGNFALPGAPVETHNIMTSGTNLLRFITFSSPTMSLFAVIQVDDDTAAIAQVFPGSGNYAIRIKFQNAIAQPIVASTTTPALTLFLLDATTKQRRMEYVDIYSWTSRTVKSYPGDSKIAVAVAGLE